jgi:small-conductance mechanosensitive channel
MIATYSAAGLLFWQQLTAVSPPTIKQVFVETQERFINAIPGLATGAIIFTVFYLVAFTGARFIAYAAPRVKGDTGVVLLLSRVFFYTVLIFGLVTALGATGLNINALIAGLGLTGFALGFALKDVLSNLLSGIMLLIYQPFRIGDQIRMNGYEGTIRTIRMRDTVVRSYDGRNIIIPNTKLITEVVVNNAAARLKREAITIGIPADSNVNEASELFLRALEQHPAITGRVEVPLRATYTADKMALLEGRFWYEPRTNEKVVKSEVSLAVKTSLDRASIKMFFPTDEEMQHHSSEVRIIEDEESKTV